MSHCEKRDQCVITIVICRLEVQNERSVGRSVAPAPSTSLEVKSLNQEIHARGQRDKRRSQHFIEEMIRFAELLFRHEDTNKALQIHRRLRIIIPVIA